MSIEAKLITITENTPKVFNAGKLAEEKYSKPLYYLSFKDFQWHKVEFPENFEFYLKTAKTPNTCNAMFSNSTGVKTITLECDDKSGLSRMSQAFREMNDLEFVDLRNFNLKMSDLAYFAYSSKKLVSILGDIDLSECSNVTSAFTNTTALENLSFKPKTIKIDLDLHWCTKLSIDSLVSILEGLYDYAVNIEAKDCYPDYSPKDTPLTPGIYEITDVTINDDRVELSTENGYKFLLEEDYYLYNWNELKAAARVGNYLDFDGYYDANNNLQFERFCIIANPEGLEYTLNLGDTNLNKLSEEQKQIALSKGWTLK